MADHVWSTIKAGDKVVKPGETVTRQALNISKDEYEQLKESGAIRSVKHPETNETESPREANIRKFAEQRKELEESMFEEYPGMYGEEGGSTLPTAKDAVEV